ncbi:P-loop containing nucleoside triphosphate hydrolase protein [Chaetomidium leptoderma]|uniref:RNA helicase n=1 Tax=Chaetomidium leptoderma TaxID=669021 RepID=A0AAN6VQ82_9PEZI|nr:P-loop containing nucleoside triphosphate hydrolase protein [Chaetomidium leptoderma]
MKSLLGTAWKPPQRAVQAFCRWRSVPTTRPPTKHKYLDPRALRTGLQQNESSTTVRRPAFVVKRHYQLFNNLVESRFQNVIESMGAWAQNQEEWRSFGIGSQTQLDRDVGLFRMVLARAFDLATEQGMTGRQANPLFWNLRNAFIRSDAAGLARELKYAFQTFLMRSRFPKAVNELHMALADLRFPYEWFPATRMIQRTIHLHVGPTNSGKTYNALKALENSRTGIYAGPLRLLAHETWSRFGAKNKPCALLTGEEMRIPTDTDTWFHSCTVEMTPLNTKVDVAVIDEIQMIASDDRGWAWTQAFLGVQAKEVHLCGEERVVPLIQDLCARIGEKCVVHEYKRLNPLETMSNSLEGKFSNLQKGDAVVAFSRVAIHQLKKGIEKETGRRCAIVYGSLPPETRASQAALFNDPNNDYDFLAASDAIGMGLNLEVKRVVFESSFKYDGVGFRPLTVPEVKQIGGRAGRYRTAVQEMTGDVSKPSPGLVTALDDEDLDMIKKAFTKEAPPIPTAGLFPPPSVIERFHSYFPPRTPISFVLARLRELSRLSPRFHMCDFSAALQIAELIKPYDLSVSDRCIFLNVPVNLRDVRQVNALQSFAKCVAELGSGHLLDFPTIDLEVLDEVRPTLPSEQAAHLHRLESLHHNITTYLWLSYRYQGVFQSQHLAFKVKTMVEAKIADHLDNLSFVPDIQRSRRQRMRAIAAQNQRKERDLLGPDEEEMIGPHDEGVEEWDQDAQEPLFGGGGGELNDGGAGAGAGVVTVPVSEGESQKGSVGSSQA